MKENPLLEKTFALAIEAVSVYRKLQNEREFMISRQSLRCATARGAMAQEAQSAQSKRDFISKLEIAQKELRECRYWLRLLKAAGYCSDKYPENLEKLPGECLALTVSVVNSMKADKS